MILSIKHGGYAFLIRLDLVFSVSLWKEFQLLEILNDQIARFEDLIWRWCRTLKTQKLLYDRSVICLKFEILYDR